MENFLFSIGCDSIRNGNIKLKICVLNLKKSSYIFLVFLIVCNSLVGADFSNSYPAEELKSSYQRFLTKYVDKIKKQEKEGIASCVSYIDHLQLKLREGRSTKIMRKLMAALRGEHVGGISTTIRANEEERKVFFGSCYSLGTTLAELITFQNHNEQKNILESNAFWNGDKKTVHVVGQVHINLVSGITRQSTLTALLQHNSDLEESVRKSLPSYENPSCKNQKIIALYVSKKQPYEGCRVSSEAFELSPKDVDFIHTLCNASKLELIEIVNSDDKDNGSTSSSIPRGSVYDNCYGRGKIFKVFAKQGSMRGWHYERVAKLKKMLEYIENLRDFNPNLKNRNFLTVAIELENTINGGDQKNTHVIELPFVFFSGDKSDFKKISDLGSLKTTIGSLFTIDQQKSLGREHASLLQGSSNSAFEFNLVEYATFLKEKSAVGSGASEEDRSILSFIKSKMADSLMPIAQESLTLYFQIKKIFGAHFSPFFYDSCDPHVSRPADNKVKEEIIKDEIILKSMVLRYFSSISSSEAFDQINYAISNERTVALESICRFMRSKIQASVIADLFEQEPEQTFDKEDFKRCFHQSEQCFLKALFLDEIKLSDILVKHIKDKFLVQQHTLSNFCLVSSDIEPSNIKFVGYVPLSFSSISIHLASLRPICKFCRATFYQIQDRLREHLTSLISDHEFDITNSSINLDFGVNDPEDMDSIPYSAREITQKFLRELKSKGIKKIDDIYNNCNVKVLKFSLECLKLKIYASGHYFHNDDQSKWLIGKKGV